MSKSLHANNTNDNNDDTKAIAIPVVFSETAGLKDFVCAYFLFKLSNMDHSEIFLFADNNFEFDENGRKSLKWIDNNVGKGEMLIRSNFSYFHHVFKRFVLQICKNQGLCGKGLRVNQEMSSPNFPSSSPVLYTYQLGL